MWQEAGKGVEEHNYVESRSLHHLALSCNTNCWIGPKRWLVSHISSNVCQTVGVWATNG